MSLNWNIEAIDEATVFVKTERGKELNGRTECLIWATMMVDLGEITEKNADKFFTRLSAWEAIGGTLCSNNEPITHAEVRAHIGLTTNVTDITDAKFAKKLMNYAKSTAERRIRLEAKQ